VAERVAVKGNRRRTVKFLREKDKPEAEGPAPNTVIGVGSTLRGTLMVEGTLRVDGEFDGDLLNCERLEIGPHGTVRVDVHVRDAFIEGTMQGSIQAEGRVVLLTGARMLGDLTCRRVVVEDGVHFSGRCVMVDDDEPLPTHSSGEGGAAGREDLEIAAGYSRD
jgi:cytoskeletal protein CcmA (bactofilin family)